MMALERVRERKREREIMILYITNTCTCNQEVCTHCSKLLASSCCHDHTELGLQELRDSSTNRCVLRGSFHAPVAACLSTCVETAVLGMEVAPLIHSGFFCQPTCQLSWNLWLCRPSLTRHGMFLELL